MGVKKRWNLVMFRGARALTQDQMADLLGEKRQQYSLVELGKRRGSEEFWAKLKKAFDIPEERMWSLMQVSEREEAQYAETCE